ncbi:DUF4189 domain-containing protein [Lysobacter enzymogenes]|uniref:DUF4189 domain-containing protein n=1 Tax=Lysobacter enzymogenes TaxID=69 RepID=UPI001AF15880|nr:DUF4189 domain-containing protein [Lysobacter enzymogenes]
MRRPQLLAIGFALLAPLTAHAEGDCPSGYYRYSTPGHRGDCVPIPALPEQAPTGPHWRKTWGAIAVDGATGATGVTVGSRTERTAKKEALERCRRDGNSQCKVVLSYEHQCAAIALPAGQSKGPPAIVAAENEYKSSQLALDDCKAKNGVTCEIAYSECSTPVLER